MRKWERLINILPCGLTIRKWLYGCSIEDGFRWHGKRPRFHKDMSIAFNVFIGNYGNLTFGKNVHIASDVNIHSHTVHFSKIKNGVDLREMAKDKVKKDIHIGDNVFIGEKSLIFKSIPDNTFIEAGTIWK